MLMSVFGPHQQLAHHDRRRGSCNCIPSKVSWNVSGAPGIGVIKSYLVANLNLGSQRVFFSLPETNKSHPKMDGWNMIVSFSDGIFSGAINVSFREGNLFIFMIRDPMSFTFTIHVHFVQNPRNTEHMLLMAPSKFYHLPGPKTRKKRRFYEP